MATFPGSEKPGSAAGRVGRMADTTPLRTAVAALADRFRSLPHSRLVRVAEAGLTLARELSAAAQRLERPGAEPVPMPDEGIYAVGDQLAVAGHDLADALASAGPPQGRAGCEAALGRVAEVAALV